MEDKILNKAIIAYGEEAQTDKAVEECAELIQALMKFKTATSNDNASTKTIMTRVNNVIDELANVDIMISQLKKIFGEKDVEKRKRFKLRRLDKRIDDLNEYNPNQTVMFK